MTNAEPATAPAGAQPPAIPIPPGTAPIGMTVSQLHDALDEALRSAGLGQVWVTFPWIVVSHPCHCSPPGSASGPSAEEHTGCRTAH